jgi:hypothetical protein
VEYKYCASCTMRNAGRNYPNFSSRITPDLLILTSILPHYHYSITPLLQYSFPCYTPSLQYSNFPCPSRCCLICSYLVSNWCRKGRGDLKIKRTIIRCGNSGSYYERLYPAGLLLECGRPVKIVCKKSDNDRFTLQSRTDTMADPQGFCLCKRQN